MYSSTQINESFVLCPKFVNTEIAIKIILTTLIKKYTSIERQCTFILSKISVSVTSTSGIIMLILKNKIWLLFINDLDNINYINLNVCLQIKLYKEQYLWSFIDFKKIKRYFPSEIPLKNMFKYFFFLSWSVYHLWHKFNV